MINRREFFERAAIAGAALPVLQSAESHLARLSRLAREFAAAPITFAAVPFDLHDVRLLPGPQLTALEINRKYMLALDPDRLLHVFRVNAGITSDARPYGGWEAPNNELRGHFARALHECVRAHGRTNG